MQGAVTIRASQRVLGGRRLLEASRSQAGSSLLCWTSRVSGPVSQENSSITSVIRAVVASDLLLLPCPVLAMPQLRAARRPLAECHSDISAFALASRTFSARFRSALSHSQVHLSHFDMEGKIPRLWTGDQAGALG